MIRWLFADDNKAMLVQKSKSDSFTLQKEFDKLVTWDLTCTMTFYPDKCNAISVTRKFNYTLHYHYFEASRYIVVIIIMDISLLSRFNIHLPARIRSLECAYNNI